MRPSWSRIETTKIEESVVRLCCIWWLLWRQRKINKCPVHFYLIVILAWNSRELWACITEDWRSKFTNSLWKISYAPPKSTGRLSTCAEHGYKWMSNFTKTWIIRVTTNYLSCDATSTNRPVVQLHDDPSTDLGFLFISPIPVICRSMWSKPKWETPKTNGLRWHM